MKKIFSASFLTIAVVLIIIGTVLILNNTKKGNENEDKNIIYNAVFELDENNRITSFKKNDKEVVVRIITKGSKATFSTELVDNKLTITIDNSNMVLEYTKDGIVVGNNKLIKEGIYKKAADYTKEEFYSDSFGSLDYVESDLNYIYRNGDSVIYLYEKGSNTIRAICNTDGKRIDLELNKSEDNTYTTTMFENDYQLDITDSGVKLTFEGKVESSFNGDYKKDKKLEMDEIISLFTAG